MKITTGLFDHMVLQRNGKDLSAAVFSGECAATGALEALVRKNGAAPPALNGVKAKGARWTAVGRAAGGRFRGQLAGLPAGGPYDIELRIEGKRGQPSASMKITDVLVGDVWVLGGQSNMAGCGRLKDTVRPDPRVRACYWDDAWGIARDPLRADRPVGPRPEPLPAYGVGPGISFAHDMLRRTGVPQGLIQCAPGGSSMTQWSPTLKKLGSRSLYGNMFRRFLKNGGKVAGVAWYQGCGETGSPETAAKYFGRMKALIRAVRRDFRAPRLPFVLVQISRVYGRDGGMAPWWNQVQDVQRRLQGAVERCATVPAIDLTLDDSIHLSTAAQKRLGKRIAQAMAALKSLSPADKLPIALKKVSIRTHPVGGSVEVAVEFANVIGRLESPSRPVGFMLANPAPADVIFDVKLEGEQAILRVGVPHTDAENMSLHYGCGLAPACNITDSADRSLPVFGPVPLGRPAARTPFVQAVRVSRFLPGAGKLNGVKCPDDSPSFAFAPRTFGGSFWDLHLEWEPKPPADLLVFFKFRLECIEPMRLAALLGYDGPVKLWVDRKEVFHDPNGTNPANPDMEKIPFRVAAGTHEVSVALGSNCGQAWGIFLRFARLDVPMNLLKQGPAFYRMPALLP